MHVAIYASCLVLALSGPQKPPAAYATAIEKYVGGDTEAAFESLARVSHADAQRQIETSVSAAESGASGGMRRRLEAIAMLHTEYALIGRVQPKEALFHIDMAHLSLTIGRWTLEHRISDTNEEDLRHTRQFLPHWYKLAVSVLLNYSSDRTAAQIIDEGIQLFPEDDTLLFWRGLVMEYRAVWVGVANTPVTNTHAWGPVEETYRNALARNPDNFEAHLHLGYALAARRNDGPARAEYEVARDRSTDPFVVYVADLLLARMKEDQNDPAGAAQAYEHALATMPNAQSAYVGLGLLEVRRGNSQRARELTTRLAAIPEERRVRDPWWAFHTSRVPVDDLHWLRAAVHQ